MAKELILVGVKELTAFQMMQIMNGRRLQAISTEECNGDPYMVCLVDCDFNHTLPVVKNPAIYDTLFNGLLDFNTPLSEREIQAIVEGILKTYPLDGPMSLHKILRGY